MSNVIHLPKPSGVFNPHRPLHKNLLIAAQVRHFEEAERHLPPELQTAINVNEIKTEGQAGDYIRKVTRALHETGGRKPQKVERAR